jgi:hypothetical protein
VPVRGHPAGATRGCCARLPPAHMQTPIRAALPAASGSFSTPSDETLRAWDRTASLSAMSILLAGPGRHCPGRIAEDGRGAAPVDRPGPVVASGRRRRRPASQRNDRHLAPEQLVALRGAGIRHDGRGSDSPPSGRSLTGTAARPT